MSLSSEQLEEQKDQEMLDYLDLYLKELRLSGYVVNTRSPEAGKLSLWVGTDRERAVLYWDTRTERWIIHALCYGCIASRIKTLEELQEALQDWVHEHS